MPSDSIEREIAIAAPIERVWAVLTESAHVGTWFGNGTPVEIDLRPGGVMVIDHGAHGVYPMRIVQVDPPRIFSYRWASGYPGEMADEANSTLVEFTLEGSPGGTLLRVVESGFDALTIPPEREQSAGFQSHSAGWSEVTANLGRYVESMKVSTSASPA